MLIAAHHRMIRSKPYLCEVEYLESTGGQYINTGIIGSSATKVEITAYTTNISTTMALFGARNTGNGNRPSYSIWRRAVQAGGERMRFDYNSASADSVVGGDWDASTVNTITKDNVSNYINGTLASTNTAHSFSLDIPFYLGTINGSGTPATYYFVGRIYSCKIWDANGNLVFDYIPVRKGTVGYLYDRISRKLFGNAGTGDFVLGPDVVPVEYIESTGTQFVNTGIVATNLDEFEIIASGDGTRRSLFGSRTSATDAFCIVQRGSAGLTDVYFSTGSDYTTYHVEASAGTAKLKITMSASLREIFNLDTQTSMARSTATMTQAFTTPDSCYLFGASGNPWATNKWVGKGYRFRHYRNGVLLQDFLPVRVGTEGAMMDVLTRRIYRNAGTGAFSYGNDLKYPIPAE